MERIQRKRTKGWRMPPNTKYVGRPGRWGNPFTIGDDYETIEEVVVAYKEHITWFIKNYPEDYNLDELRGKNLTCFCPLDKPCHVDVLIELCKEGEKDGR